MSSKSLAEQLNDESTVKRFTKWIHANLALREAVQLNKRVNYFRGKRFIELLTSDPEKTELNRPVVKNEAEAKMVGIALLKFGMIHASEVANKKKKELRPVRANDFSAEGYYTWIYEGSKTMRNLLLVLLVGSITAMCLFPIWPASIKVGVWYVSVTLLLILFGMLFVRLVLYVVCWTVGFEVWILPNFFDDDLGVVDSFRPLFSASRGTDLVETGLFRAAGLAMVISFGYWCYQQPTEFDELYAQQMDFLSELYDGKLLADPALEEEELKKKAIPNVEELEKALEEEENEQIQDLDEEDNILEKNLDDEEHHVDEQAQAEEEGEQIDEPEIPAVEEEEDEDEDEEDEDEMEI